MQNMKPIFILLLLITFTEYIYAQKWQIGLNLNPNMRHVIYRNRTPLPPPFVQKPHIKESPLVGIDLGFTLKYKLSNKFRIGTGFFYSNKGFIYGPVATAGKGRIDEYGFEIAAESDIGYHFNFIEIPVSVQYNFESNRVGKLYLHLGVAPNFMIKDYRTVDIIWGNLTNEQENSLKSDYDAQNYYYRQKNMELWLGIGIRENPSPNIEVVLEPNFKVHLMNLNTNETTYKVADFPDKRYLYSVGVNIAIHYTLGKTTRDPDEVDF